MTYDTQHMAVMFSHPLKMMCIRSCHDTSLHRKASIQL